MSDNFTIGAAPVGTDTPCQLTFHEFIMYDSVNWNQNGYICWDNTLKQFYLVPFPSEISNNITTPLKPAFGIKKNNK